MKIICNKEILISSINKVSKAVSSKNTKPILDCILLKASIDEFKIIANNLELGIETRVTNSVIVEVGSIALEAKTFSEIIKHLPNEDIEISTDENNSTIIKCVKSEYKISGLAGDEFPDLPEIQKDFGYKMKQSKLKDMIKQTIFSVSTDESKPTLTGELVEITNNSFNLVSVDGFRISFRTLKLENEYIDIQAIIPGSSLNEISKVLLSNSTDITLYFTDKHVLFDLGDTTIVSRTIEGEFLKYATVFLAEAKTIINKNRKEIITCIERASILSRDSKKNPIKLEIKKDKLIITSNSELGTAYEELDINLEGEELIIAFNPKYLLDALKAIEDENIQICFTSNLSPCIIKSDENDEYKYLILPVKING